MSEEHVKTEDGRDFDLDEDLFDFGNATSSVWDDQEEADLDAIFAGFEAEEQARKEAEANQDEELFDEPGELPPPEDFAGLRPADPSPAIPRPAEGARDATPPIQPPSENQEKGAPAKGTGIPARARREAPAAPEAPPVPGVLGVPAPAPGQVYYQAVPVAAPAAAPPAGGGTTRGVRVAAWILIAVTSINALVALVALKSTGDLRQSVADVGYRVTETATEMMHASLSASPSAEGTPSADPLSAPNPENHPTFELAREEIQRGEYAKARRRLYGLLAIVDRIDPLEREQVEARANYLIARATHLEAVEKWERRK